MNQGFIYLLQKLAEAANTVMLNTEPFQGTLGKGWCGPSSLKIVLDYYGDNREEQELATACKSTEERGTSGEQLKTGAESFGYKVDMQDSSTLDDLKEWLNKDVPVIVDWFTRGGAEDESDAEVAGGHYSVIVGMDDTSIYLNDPEIGRIRTIPFDKFMSVWFDFQKENLKNPHDIILQRLIAVHK